MWYKNAFRRIVIDMHIPDWDERFLSEFDPQNYVAMLKLAHAQSIVLYAQSHVGLFNYPTQVGVMHRGLRGRDIFGELVELCHQNDIAAVAYTSLIFDRWAATTHPDWRIKLMDGSDAGATWRFGLCCPNSPYRDYAAQWATGTAGALPGGRHPFRHDLLAGDLLLPLLPGALCAGGRRFPAGDHPLGGCDLGSLPTQA